VPARGKRKKEGTCTPSQKEKKNVRKTRILPDAITLGGQGRKRGKAKRRRETQNSEEWKKGIDNPGEVGGRRKGRNF